MVYVIAASCRFSLFFCFFCVGSRKGETQSELAASGSFWFKKKTQVFLDLHPSKFQRVYQGFYGDARDL